MPDTNDVNDPTAEAKELASVGMTEGEIELANGEQIGDRLGDTPVAGVAQTRTGDGELLSHATVAGAISTIPAVTEAGTTTPAVVAIDTGELYVHVSLFRRALNAVEHVVENEAEAVARFVRGRLG